MINISSAQTDSDEGLEGSQVTGNQVILGRGWDADIGRGDFSILLCFPSLQENAFMTMCLIKN